MKGGYYDIRTRRTWTVACLLMLVGLLIVTARGVVQAQEPGATTSTVPSFGSIRLSHDRTRSIALVVAL